MGKNRNKNKHRKKGGKFMIPIEKIIDLERELCRDHYDSRFLVKITKNIGFGNFDLISVLEGKTLRGYCRYMFTSNRSPDYAIAEGKYLNDIQLVVPVSNDCGNQYIIKHKAQSIVDKAEGNEMYISNTVDFYTEEELAEIVEDEKISCKKEIISKKNKIILQEYENDEEESVRVSLQIMIPSLERKLKNSKLDKFVYLEASSLIKKLKRKCNRDEAKDYVSQFKKIVKSV
jgi:hypothetical protein